MGPCGGPQLRTAGLDSILNKKLAQNHLFTVMLLQTRMTFITQCIKEDTLRSVSKYRSGFVFMQWKSNRVQCCLVTDVL